MNPLRHQTRRQFLRNSGLIAATLSVGSLGAARKISANDKLNIGVIGAHPAGSASAYELRAFFLGDSGTVEDPVTGSLNASAGQWLVGAGRVTPPYLATQGAALGRSGQIHIDADSTGQIWVGGDAVTCVSGSVEL